MTTQRFNSLDEFLAHARNADLSQPGTPDPPGWVEERLAEMGRRHCGEPVAFGCSCGHTNPDDCPYELGEGGP